MSVKRKDLSFLDDENLSRDDKVKKVLDLIHSEVDAVRDERDEIQSKLDKMTTDLEAANKAKEKAETDYTNLKNENQNRETKSAKEAAYSEILKSLKISDKRIASILKLVDFDSVELVDGKIKEADKLTETLKEEWSEFIPAEQNPPAPVDNPPARKDGQKELSEMTMEEFVAARKK